MAKPRDKSDGDRTARARSHAASEHRTGEFEVGAAHLRLRAELMDAVRDAIQREGLRQSDAAALFGVAQPRVSDLVRGKIELFSIDTLVGMLAAAGVRVDVKLRRVRDREPPARVRSTNR